MKIGEHVGGVITVSGHCVAGKFDKTSIISVIHIWPLTDTTSQRSLLIGIGGAYRGGALTRENTVYGMTQRFQQWHQ